MTTYTALRTPVQRGRAGWNALLPEPPPPQVLEDNQTADVTIIGAGFAGLSAARRLKQLVPDARIAVLEAGRVGDGAAAFVRSSSQTTTSSQQLGSNESESCCPQP